MWLVTCRGGRMRCTWPAAEVSEGTGVRVRSVEQESGQGPGRLREDARGD